MELILSHKQCFVGMSAMHHLTCIMKNGKWIIFCAVYKKQMWILCLLDKLIGVHCTHGLNRTGYLICRWDAWETNVNFWGRGGLCRYSSNWIPVTQILAECKVNGMDPRPSVCSHSSSSVVEAILCSRTCASLVLHIFAHAEGLLNTQAFLSQCMVPVLLKSWLTVAMSFFYKAHKEGASF